MNTIETLERDFLEHNKLLTRLIDEVDQRLLGLDMREMSEVPHSATILLFIKAIKSAKVVRNLINSGYGQDALHIACQLFEVMISLEFIAKDPQTRAKNFLEYYYYRIEERNRRLEQYGSAVVVKETGPYKGSDEWAKTSLQEKCQQVNREKEYQLVYFQLNESSHSGVAGLNYYTQRYTNSRGNKIQMFNAGPRETATSDAYWLNLYFIRTIIEAVKTLGTPHFIDIDSGLDLVTNKCLVIEQVAVRLKRMFRQEFPELPINIDFNTTNFKLTVKHVTKGENQKYSMDGDYEGFFLQESLLGYAYQIFKAACKRLKLSVPAQDNYISYNF